MVRRGGDPVSLTRTEWLLLQHLVANAGKVMVNVELLSKVWGPEYRDDLQYLRVWISRLRHKLEVDPSHPKLIKTKQGIGYLLDVPPESIQPADAAIAS
jgi:two-component system KDP operon response regulator KdpE